MVKYIYYASVCKYTGSLRVLPIHSSVQLRLQKKGIDEFHTENPNSADVQAMGEWP